LLELTQAFHLLQHVLQQLLAPHNIKVALDLRILLGKSINFLLRETAAKAGVELAGKLSSTR
jgi:hypothetical protein|tara:strand:- start:6901 stop:7086 length:186 start_codon:yes stop_codon:yes gene_type:complete